MMFDESWRCRPVLVALVMLTAACGGGPDQLGVGRAEGVDSTLAAEPAGDGSTPATTTPASSTPSTAGPGSVPEPSVTVPPQTLPPPRPIPRLTRIEPALVPLTFDDQTITEVRAGTIAGAGEISVFGEADVYTFEVSKGQAFVVEQLGGCSFDGEDDAMSLDIRGSGVNRGTVFLDGDCSSVTRFEPDVSGSMEITVDNPGNDVVGAYAFRVIEVSDPAPLPLESGDVVFPDDPAGTGWIEGFGHRDLYSYEVRKDRPFVIRQLGGCGFDGQDDAMSGDVRGAGINRGFVFLDGDCDSVTRFEPEVTGSVEIIVANAGNDVFGHYAFQIYDVVTSDQEADDVIATFGAVETGDGLVISLSETVLFDFGSSALRRSADEVLVQLAEALRFSASEPVTIVGHTDSVGPENLNQQLSEERARAVADRLVLLGVAPEALVAEGRGEAEPVADNVTADGSDDPEGRAQNRRVEVIIGT